MAKRTSGQQQPADHGKIRFVYAEVEGNNQSLQDLMRTMLTAMSRPVQVLPAARVVSGTATGTAPQAIPSDPSLFEPDDVDNPSEEDSGPAVSSPEPQATRGRRGEGQNRDRNAGLSIVKTLDLRPDGKASLKEFYAEKMPQTQMEQIAVFTYYLKRVLEENNVGFSHLLTCFKEVGVRLPADIPQTARNVASKNGWIDTARQDDLGITTRGGNFVEHELPKAMTNGDVAK